MRFQARFAVSGTFKCGFKHGLRFWNLWNAVLCAVCGFITFSGCGFPQISMRFAVLDENSAFWSNFRKALLPKVEETTHKNVRSMVIKSHPRQTAPTATASCVAHKTNFLEVTAAYEASPYCRPINSYEHWRAEAKTFNKNVDSFNFQRSPLVYLFYLQMLYNDKLHKSSSLKG